MTLNSDQNARENKNDRRERKDVKCVVDEWLLPQDVTLLGHN